MVSKKPILPVVSIDDTVIAPENQTNDIKGVVCRGCPLENKLRVVGTGASGKVDIMFVSESPSSWSSNNQKIFYGRGGRIIRQTWDRFCKMDKDTGGTLKFGFLRKWDCYAVQCQVEEGRDQSATIPKAVIDRCSCYLRSAILHKRPKVIVAFGSTVLKSLGVKTEKFTEIRGKQITTQIEGHQVIVIPTFSTKHLIAKTGLYNLFFIDFVRAMRLASGADKALVNTSIEEIIKNYRFPKTVEEVKTLCQEIIEYTVPGASEAAQCALAVDIETNTLHPQRPDAQMLCISFAWGEGLATAIPLWHNESPWTDEELVVVIEHIQRVLQCAKPKIFHNGKFDLKFIELRHGWKVNNFAWDTMLGEHLLREDQAGSYSLKILGRSYFPQFTNYADKVHEIAASFTVDEQATQVVLNGVRAGKVKKNTPGFDDGMFSEMSKTDLEKYLVGHKKDRRKRSNDVGYSRVPLDTLLPYAAIDTDLTRRLLKNQFARMKEDNFLANAKSLMNTHCLPASRVLGKMEFQGMRVDRPYVLYLEQELTKVVAKKDEELRSYWDPQDGEFNPNSTANLSWVLYNRGIKDEEAIDPLTGKKGVYIRRVGPWTERNVKSGQYKTDKKTLRAIVEYMDCLFTKALLDYRSAFKALSGFIHDINILSEADGFLHTNFHLHGTSTGRLSSNDLNMQNLAEWLAGYNIKKIFIADNPDEDLIVNLDYKGAEIRVFTAYAPDKELIKALNDGLDVHSFFTQEIYGIPYADVERLKDVDKKMKKTRTNVKRVVFGILYGAMAKKIAETAGISIEEAQGVIDKLFARFPALVRYMDETVEQIHRLGFVETLFGRRRRFPLQGVNGFFQGQAERRGKNMKIQSTSSDIVLGQLTEVAEHIHELGGRLCITVHDSIVACVKKAYVKQLPDFLDYYAVKRVSEKYPWLPVSFTCDISVGSNYGELTKLHEYLAQQASKTPTTDETLLDALDQEAIDELRQDEENEEKFEKGNQNSANRTGSAN